MRARVEKRSVLGWNTSDINENYINYIDYHPKLVKKTCVNKLVVADTGAAGRYLKLYPPCDNKKIAVIPLPKCMRNGEIITSAHTALLSKPDLPIESRKAHIFPGLGKALMSIGTFCRHGYQVVLNDKEVIIINKRNGKIMMKVDNIRFQIYIRSI